jgi:hypothetical protein
METEKTEKIPKHEFQNLNFSFIVLKLTRIDFCSENSISFMVREA